MIQAEEPPPPLPVYDQPPMPAPGHIWTPGYWAWNTYDYYWVPGVWVPPPQARAAVDAQLLGLRRRRLLLPSGLLGAACRLLRRRNYGYGYNGLGYDGGRWEGPRFVYNTTVNNFGGVHVTNLYTAERHSRARREPRELQRRSRAASR